ncbi:MAG: hypothetical protein GF320_18055 [Armatimonadia bacterium]|nr:hypothetical protein [Armatimonadia bacterium]
MQRSSMLAGAVEMRDGIHQELARVLQPVRESLLTLSELGPQLVAANDLVLALGGEQAPQVARDLEAVGRLLDLVDAKNEHESQVNEDLSGRSISDAARIVIEEAGEPLHASIIYREITSRGVQAAGAQSVASVLQRDDTHFRRVAPNTWALTTEPPRPT